MCLHVCPLEDDAHITPCRELGPIDWARMIAENLEANDTAAFSVALDVA